MNFDDAIVIIETFQNISTTIHINDMMYAGDIIQTPNIFIIQFWEWKNSKELPTTTIAINYSKSIVYRIVCSMNKWKILWNYTMTTANNNNNDNESK